MRTIVNVYYLQAVVVTGCTPSPSFVNPFASTSLTEFWGKRWNLPIRDLLGDLFFFPLKGLGYPMLGKASTFGASAMWHMYPLLFIGASTRNCVFMGLFFVMQVPVIAAETWMGMHGHLWFWCAMFCLAPLFLEPVGELLGDYEY
jgi:hypothetical protein